ncbi:MAG: hypothetical protein PUP93_05390 [Rhizonema sp. NSF051]|nr:hypothetical protein [Rhizonema sp. NSF051]
MTKENVEATKPQFTLVFFSFKKLTPVEKVLFCPYLKFMEEHVSIPCQRVCAASLQQQNSNALTLVEQMLPMSSEISATVYCRLIEIFLYYRSKTGFLSHPDIGHSCLRDLDMFQAYLWLCVLAESLVFPA